MAGTDTALVTEQFPYTLGDFTTKDGQQAAIDGVQSVEVSDPAVASVAEDAGRLTGYIVGLGPGKVSVTWKVDGHVGSDAEALFPITTSVEFTAPDEASLDAVAGRVVLGVPVPQ
jgi:hypothetical protein